MQLTQNPLEGWSPTMSSPLFQGTNIKFGNSNTGGGESRCPTCGMSHSGGQGFNQKTGAWMDGRPTGQQGYPTTRPTVSYNHNGIPSLGYEKIPLGEKSVGQQQTEYMNARGAPSASQWSAHENVIAEQLRYGKFNNGMGPQAMYQQKPKYPQI